MAAIKYTCPPQSVSGQNTFANDLVGLQLVQGGGLTQGNFAFVSSITEKSNRDFIIGVFSEPITLDSMGVESIEESKAIIAKNFKVFPNFDLSEVSNFSTYGSLSKRFSVSITKIINFFPASLDVVSLSSDFIYGNTATNIQYLPSQDETYLEVNLSKVRNPFDIEYTVNATRNLELREIEVSGLRNLTTEYKKYTMYVNGSNYDVVILYPSLSAETGVLSFYVKGNPFPNQTTTTDTLVIRPTDYYTEFTFSQNFDEVEKFLLNRLTLPIYTSVFQVPKETDGGSYYIDNNTLTWPLDGSWNVDIRTPSFENYIERLSNIADEMDTFKTNTVVRFLTTDAFKEFDTPDQKMLKLLGVYGRSFDEVKKFIDALAYMNSVNYNTGNDIPSQLLKNLSETLGWKTNISPITNDDFLDSVFNSSSTSEFPGYSRTNTPDELNYQYYKNLVLNSAYLFKSKGTRNSIEGLLRLIGAPEALIDFNETVYLADQKINMSQFNDNYMNISGGTYITYTPVLDTTITFNILGQQYTGFTVNTSIFDASISIEDYPIDSSGFPKPPPNSENFFFQQGSGWFEQTPSHRGLEIFDQTNSVFTGSNPNYQTYLQPYTYGQKYLDRFRNFPYSDLGFKLTRINDNNKSWTDKEVGIRRNSDGNNAYYFTSDDKLVLNVKNVDLFMNPAQGIAYDVWFLSSNYNYPIPSTGLTPSVNCYCPTYANPVIYDRTQIDPNPSQKTFFEFAQTFWQNMINVRNRQFITDGKTSGYPTLQSIYWKYLQTASVAGIPNNQFNYQKMISYVEGLGDYWIRLVEQMVPATTIWNTGTRYENSIFHKQKFVWRRQRGCQIVPIPCKPCIMDGVLFPYDCPTSAVECSLYPWNNDPRIQNFGGVLNIVLTNYLAETGYNISNCDTTSISTEWYVDIRLNGNQIVNYKFFEGYGLNQSFSSPSPQNWLDGLTSQLDELLNYGLNYVILDDVLIINNLTCTNFNLGNDIQVNVGINFNIYCK
jgi:hypothetical protein